MSKSQGSRATLSRHIVGSLLGVGIFAALAVGVLAYWTMAAVDQDSIARQSRYVVRGLEEAIAKLPKEQQSSAIWDDAVLKVRANDQAWMEENLGLWMGTYFGHDRVYVVDAANRPVHAMKDEVTVDPSAFEAESTSILPLVAQLRNEMAVASQGDEDSTEALADVGVEDFVMLNGMPALVSVLPILPSSDRVQQRPGTEFVHISVQLLDQTFIDGIAQPFELRDAQLASASEATTGPAVPVENSQSRILGFVKWSADRPGFSTLVSVGPAVLAVFLGGLAIVVWLTRRLRRSSTKLEASEAQAQFLAFHDVLTGLPNRALFEDRLDRALVNASRDGQQCALLMVDIDRFKNVNDTLGHPAGDELIRLVGKRLSDTVRDIDTVARLGGDEFAIIQPGVESDQEAELLAERLLQAMEQQFSIAGEIASVTISVGIVLAAGQDTSSTEMQRKADIALYEAKAKGRARFQLFDGDMDDVVRRRRTIERELRNALMAGKQLRVVYQPLFAGNGRTLVGAEALVRWDHPIHGLLSPELFIGIAEERGLIDQLGDWVLREACSTAVRLNLPWVAVNVSPIQFRNKLLADKILSALTDTGLSPRRLQIEITEGVLLEQTELAQTMLTRLRAHGVRIALDDFGTGYSSMSYLGRYNVDKLKIDRSFINQLGSSTDADAIVRAMITLGRSMHLQITAEGVETEEQRDHLAAIGCHELQGYLLGRPVPAEQLDVLFSKSRADSAAAVSA